VADLVLVLLAGWIVQQQPHPLTPIPLVLTVLCVMGACGLALVPFRMEHEARVKLAESSSLTTAVAEINRLREAADHIRHATSQWQGVQEHSGKAVTAAREVADRITTEAREFAAFLQKANDTEKNHLRLEVEKLRRAEGDWLQSLVRILDHVFALHQAAQRSSQRQVAEQLSRFQQACRECTRRIGLIAFEAGVDEPFDTAKHQLVDPNGTAPSGASITETLACGFTYQGQLLRRALVRLSDPAAPAPAPAPAAEQAAPPVADAESAPATPVAPATPAAAETPDATETAETAQSADVGSAPAAVAVAPASVAGPVLSESGPMPARPARARPSAPRTAQTELFPEAAPRAAATDEAAPTGGA
jgi:molecular chaperone GrpE (heat shock protein)